MLPPDLDPRIYAGPHLRWSELACINRLVDETQQPRPFAEAGCVYAPGETVACYPLDWRPTRGRALARVFGAIRGLRGQPLLVTSAYRTRGYNAAVGGAGNSQHLLGLAIDLYVAEEAIEDLYQEVADRARRTALIFSEIGGLGKGQNFLHVDLRRRPDGRLVEWTY